ncbi:MAG: septum formation initiator family protein [Rickettsiales bacterium]|nr:septum formation initiator family protein [Rickettsiales bacterium]
MLEEKKENILLIILKTGFYLFLVIYLVYHIFNGNYGILSYKDAGEVLIERKNLLNNKEQHISRQKNKIDRLSSDNIDLDLLDEKLRENVGMVKENEIVLFTDDLKNI